MIPRLSDLLGGALKGAGLESTSVIWQIAESWTEIVGPRIAARAAPVRLRGGELTLSAPDAVWRQELTLLGPEVAAKVNQKLGREAIARIRLVSGEVRSPEPARRRRRLRVPNTTGAPSDGPGAPRRPRPTTAPSSVAAALEALASARADRLGADRRALQARHRPRRPRPRGR